MSPKKLRTLRNGEETIPTTFVLLEGISDSIERQLITKKKIKMDPITKIKSKTKIDHGRRINAIRAVRQYGGRGRLRGRNVGKPMPRKRNIRDQKRMNRYKNYGTRGRNYQTTRRGNETRRRQGRGRGSRYNNRGNRKFRGATRRGRARYRNNRGRGRNRRSYGRRGNYANNIVNRNNKGNNNTKGKPSWKDKLPRGKTMNQNSRQLLCVFC